MTKEIVAERLSETSVGADRLIDVEDGGKAAFDHDHRAPEAVSGNYGIHAQVTDNLLILDVDDYGDIEDESGLEALDELPQTFEQVSPHTDREGKGGHRLYEVPPDDDGRLIAKRLKDEFGAMNPNPSWGEVRVSNYYVVGAGSQLDGCDKEWCDECATADGGRYEIKSDREIATVSADTVVDVLGKDPDLDCGEDTADVTDYEDSESNLSDDDNDGILDYALTESNDEKLQRLWRGDYSDYGGDRSEAESALAYKLAFWLQGDKQAVRRAMDRANTQKWSERTDDSYRESVLEAVDKCGEYFEPQADDSREEAPEYDEAKVALESILSLYERDPDREMEHEAKIWKVVGQLDESDVDDYADRVADVLDTSARVVEAHAARVRHEEEYGPIVVENGKTWYLTGEPRVKRELLNFELDVKSFLSVERGAKRAELMAKLQDGETFEKAIEPKVFNRKERFDDEVLGESFGTKMDTNVGSYDELLDALRMWVYHQDAPERIGVHQMGFHDGEFVVPDGALTADGWEDEPETVYLEREIGPERRVSLPDSDEYNAPEVAEIVETLPYTRDTERLLPVLGWFYAAPLRPLVESFSESGEFNHLNVTGDTGSGKTTTLGYLWKCFGMDGKPFSVDASPFAQIATFASTNSIPLWFDEYKPSDIADYKLDRFHDKYRKANRGAFEERGNADKTTESYKIEAPVVLSGEQSIQGPAERRRTIMTQFRTETTDPETDTAETFKDLVGKARVEDGEVSVPDDAASPQDHALAYYRFVTGLDDETVRDTWHSALEYAAAKAHELGVYSELDDLELQGLQTVVFGFKIYREFARHVSADMSALPGEEELDSALDYVVERIGPGGSRKSHTDRFVELFARAAAADYVEKGEQYDVVHEGTPREQVRINLPRAFDKVSKYAADHDLGSEDLLNKHTDYRDRFAEMESNPASYVECTQQYTPPVSKCTGLSTLKLMNELDFDRQVLGDLAEIEGDDQESADSDGPDGGDDHPSPRASAADSAPTAAATDGGQATAAEPTESVECEQVEETVKKVVIHRVAGDETTVSEVLSKLETASREYTPDEIKGALDSLSSKGRTVNHIGGTRYELL